MADEQPNYASNVYPFNRAGGDKPLKGGGGDGTSSDMEARVARLERQIDTIGKDVNDMRVDVGSIKENVRHLPTKPWIFTSLMGAVTVIAGLVGIIVRFIPHAS